MTAFLAPVVRVALWVASFLLGVGLFSLLFYSIYGNPFHGFGFAFSVTLKFALIPALLCLPVVVALRDARSWRLRTILATGLLIGPAFIAVLGFTSHWHSDPLAPSFAACFIFALIVGSFTTALYVMAQNLVTRPAAR